MPVIILGDQRAVYVKQLNNRILQRINNAGGTEARADSTQDDNRRFPAVNDQSADQHVIAGSNKTARAHVVQG